MSVELESLLGEGGSTNLQDLVTTEKPTDKPILNKSTANNLAAHTAVLANPEEAVSTYRTIRNELSLNSGSPTMDTVLGQANNRENDLTKAALVDILSDENIPIDQKMAAASNWRDSGLVERTPEELVAINALEKEGSVPNNEEVNQSRWDLLPHLMEVNRYNDEVQKMINEAEVDSNPDVLENAVNFLEIVVPFMEGAAVAEVQTSLREYKGANKTAGIIRSLGLLGESKDQIRKVVSSVPIEQRLELAKAVYNMTMSSEGSIIRGKNSMILMDSLRNYLVEGHYTMGDRVVDDITSVLDLFGVGATVRAGKASLKSAKSAANAAKFTRRTPKAVGETLANTNDKQFTGLLKAAADDETGEVAKTVFNSSKEDAVVNAVGPEIGNADDVVRHKPLVDDGEFNPDLNVVEQVSGGRGYIQFTEAEKASKVSKVEEDFLNPDVTGIVAHREMTTIKAVDEGVHVRTVYGPAEGGFKDANQALSQIRLATKKYGVLDEELSVLKRQPDGTYKPVEKTEIGPNSPNGNYVVSVNHTSKYDPSDTINWSVTGVEGKAFGLIPLNLFDKFPSFLRGKGGSITQHLIPPSSYIDPILTRAATVATDQTAKSVDAFLGLADTYASQYKKLSGHMQKAVDNYIVKANHESLKFNPVALKADGFSDEAIETLRAWKRTNDTLYVLENLDLVRQSRRRGYLMFKSADGADEFMVRPLAANKAGDVVKAYDSDTKTIVNIATEEKQKLYKEGGYLATARYPVNINGETIPHVIVKNNTNNYTRALSDSDKLLNYRDGHFTIYYNDPVFITQVVENADGSKYTRAIATAGSVQDADAHIARLRASDPEGVYDRRWDLKGEEFDDMMFNARVNQGRTAQRARGKLLADASDRPTDMQFRHVAPPEESLLRSINSIAHRINMKEFIDTARARFTKQYQDYLPRHPETHAPVWPDDVTQLRAPRGQKADMDDFADAKSTYRYIDQMENGFLNLLDEGSKNFFKTFAETSGAKGWGWMEKGARAAAEGTPTAYVRKKAFRLMLAANPLRQVLVQASQAVPVVLATNPTYIAKLPAQSMFLRYLDRGGDAESFVKGLDKKLAGLTVEEGKALEKAYRESGISSAVSAHSLIRDDMKSLVARGPIAKARAIVGKPIDVMQRYGFELGENILMKTVWLSEYDVLRRSGKTIDKAALDMLHSRVRDLTLNMNKAGELAYNENAFSAVMQFMQAPHKAFAQIVLGHRGLSTKDRVALGTSYLLTYGTGYGLLYDQATKLIPADNKELQNVVAGGMFNLALNRFLGTVYGEPVDVDFSGSMRLIDMPNVPKMWESMVTMNMEEVLKNSPSMSLLFSDNGKLGNLIRSIGRVWTVPEDDGNFKDVGVNFLNLFSGASNILKARYIMKKGYAISTKGEVVDRDVNPVEAMMRVAGFTTIDEVLQYSLNDKTYFSSKTFKNDVKYVLDETSRRLARDGISETEMDWGVRMLMEANRVWGDNPYAMEQIQSEIRRRNQSGDFVILNRLIDMAKIASPQEMREAISRAPIPEEDRKNLMQLMEMMKRPEE